MISPKRTLLNEVDNPLQVFAVLLNEVDNYTSSLSLYDNPLQVFAVLFINEL